MFKWLHKSGVISDKGFKFECVHRYYSHYTEGDHVMVIYVEGYFDHSNTYRLSVSSPSGSKWEPPYELEDIHTSKKNEIIKNVDDALTFMKIEHEFVDSDRREV